MTLTDSQRHQLGTYAEWRDLQIAMHNVYAYLSFTKLEDIQMQSVLDALDQISMRRAAFLEQFSQSQGGGR
ncbi:MAG: hypothetical protein ACRCTG_11035 [Aestuariivirga sp.]